MLIKTQRAPEAALFARTYAPSKVPEAVRAWKGELEAKGRGKLSAPIAHPEEHVELFEEGWEEALKHEKEGSAAVPPPPAPVVNVNGNLMNGTSEGELNVTLDV